MRTCSITGLQCALAEACSSLATLKVHNRPGMTVGQARNLGLVEVQPTTSTVAALGALAEALELRAVLASVSFHEPWHRGLVQVALALIAEASRPGIVQALRQ